MNIRLPAAGLLLTLYALPGAAYQGAVLDADAQFGKPAAVADEGMLFAERAMDDDRDSPSASDDGAGHDAGDDNGDDGDSHDAGDDNGDDGDGHDAGDDHGDDHGGDSDGGDGEGDGDGGDGEGDGGDGDGGDGEGGDGEGEGGDD